MNRIRSLLVVTGLATALGAGLGVPALAHHSFGFYEMTKTAEIQGTVQKFEWSNPHCWLFVSVVADGKELHYGFEMSSVGEMLRRGWKKTSLRPGDKVQVKFRPMRDGTPAGLLMSAADGEGKPIGQTVRGEAPPSTPAPAP